MHRRWIGLLTGLVLAAAGPGARAQAADSRAVEELRNTLVSVMEALVQKGVLTREQAQQIVTEAQTKGAAAAQARADQDAAEKDAVRVTYVPDNIKADIGGQVSAEIRPAVVRDVLAAARSEGWGVPGALPAWLNGLDLYGDVRFRAEQADYARDNAQFSYLNFDTINQTGGIGKAGVAALLNTTQDRFKSLGRMRLGLTADLGGSFKMDLRLTSGIGRNPGATNQPLGAYGARGTTNVDKAAVIWDRISTGRKNEIEIRFGRFDNPYVTTSELVWDNDLTFEGVSASYALDLFGHQLNRMERSLFVTVGATPVQEIELSNKDKWLYGAQLGTELPFGASSKFRFTGAYYLFRNMAGIRNAPDSTLYDYTAPRFLQKGNTVFDIRNSTTDTSVNLFALASDFRLAEANFSLDVPFMRRQRLLLSGDFVRNLGFNAATILARTGTLVPARVNGYDLTLSVGSEAVQSPGSWRASFGYRYLERDAVVDAFTDSDFRLGGTDVKGYQAGFEIGLSRNTSIRARLLSASEIDGPPLAVDVLQVDVNGRF